MSDYLLAIAYTAVHILLYDTMREFNMD